MSSILLVNETLSSSGDTAEAVWPGGEGTLVGIDGGGSGFGGGTLSLKYSLDGGTNYIVDSAETLTAEGGFNFNLPAGALVLGNLAGATTPTVVVQIAQEHGHKSVS